MINSNKHRITGVRASLEVCKSVFLKQSLASIVVIRNLITMITDSHKRHIYLSILLMFVIQGVMASEYSRVHSANRGIAINDYGSVPVYKFTDSKGKVTYSTSASVDFIRAEKIAIISPPSSQQLNASKRRFEEMRIAVDEFDVARAERQVVREQNEIKRLQRIALINQAKLLVVTREFIYPASPYRLRKKHGDHYGIPTHLPSRRPRSTGLSLPPSSFPATFH